MNQIACEPTPLAPLVVEVAEAFQPLARARGAELALDIRDEVAAPVDRSALTQMLLNLLDNAVKYGPVGQTIRLTLSFVDGHTRLSVEDEGPGIPEACRARVWEPFWRMERERASAVAGTGIGLAVVRELCDLHGGRAWIESGERAGARVVLELPGAEVVSGATASEMGAVRPVEART